MINITFFLFNLIGLCLNCFLLDFTVIDVGGTFV